MKFEITTEVTHEINDNYDCLLAVWDENDFHFKHTDPMGDKVQVMKGETFDWMPKDIEVLTLVQIMVAISPTFKKMFDKWVSEYE